MVPPRTNSNNDGFRLTNVEDSIKELWEISRTAERNADASLAELVNINKRLDRHHEQVTALTAKVDQINEKGCIVSKMNKQDIATLKEMQARLVILQERQADKFDNLSMNFWQQKGIEVFIQAIVLGVLIALVKYFLG